MQRKSVLSQETVPKKGCTSNFVDPEQKLLVVLEEPETWDNSEMDSLFSIFSSSWYSTTVSLFLSRFTFHIEQKI